MNTKVLIFIPAKDEEKTIGSVIKESLTEVEKIVGQKPNILVIDDGSIDNTMATAQKTGAIAIRHAKNLGLARTFQEAVEYALENYFDIMLTIDADGQFSTKDIPTLLNPVLADEADFTTGSRFLKNSQISGMPKILLAGNWIVSKIISFILKRTYKDVSCGFRVYNREALLNLNLFGNFTYTQEVFLNLGFKNLRIMEKPITVQYFRGRRSRIARSLFNYGWQTKKLCLKFMIYYIPMRFFGTLAAIFFSTGFLIDFVLGIRYCQTGFVTPYKVIGIIGLTMIGLGILFFIAGTFLQAVSRLQTTADRLLYYARKKNG